MKNRSGQRRCGFRFYRIRPSVEMVTTCQGKNLPLRWMASLPAGSFIPSLMSQYTPFYKAAHTKPLNRRISTWEYRQVIGTAIDLGLTDGYMQQKSSAREEYTPSFDLTGI